MIGDFNQSDSGKEKEQAVLGSVVQKTHSPTDTGVRYVSAEICEERRDRSCVRRLPWLEAAINETPPDQKHLATEDYIRKSRQKGRVTSIEVTACPYLAERWRKEAKGKNGRKLPYPAKRRIALGEWLNFIKGYGAAKRERYKRESGEGLK